MKSKLIFLSILFLTLFGWTESSWAADFYITQNASGSNTGADCANAHAVSWFNTNATSGNTYYLCGAFTGTGGSSMLTVPTSGPMTILFESGAVMAAPYWGDLTAGSGAGAINILNKSDITIDGGTNGVIQNTANGTFLSNQHASVGIFASTSNNFTVRNLMVKNIYVNGGEDPTIVDNMGFYSANIYISGSPSNVAIYNNTLDGARSGVNMGPNGASDNIAIYNNIIKNHGWGIVFGADTDNASYPTNVKIYGNKFSDWLAWQCPGGSTAGICDAGGTAWSAGTTYAKDAKAWYGANIFVNKVNGNIGHTPPLSANSDAYWRTNDVYHTDGIIIWQRKGSYFAPEMYNNYFEGSLGGGSASGYIYCTYGVYSASDNIIKCISYNNVIRNGNGWAITTTGRGGEIYNNTVHMASTSNGYPFVFQGTGHKFYNNITINGNMSIASSSDTDSGETWFANGGGADNNIFYNTNGGSNGRFPSSWCSLSTWQSLRGVEADSTTSNPGLDSNLVPISDSSYAINRGRNISSIISNSSPTGIDILAAWPNPAAITRPQGSAWDIGAYEYVSGDTTPPAAPSGLSVT